MTYLLRRTCAACFGTFEVTMVVGDTWPTVCQMCDLRESLRPTVICGAGRTVAALMSIGYTEDEAKGAQSPSVSAQQGHRVVRQRPIVPLMSTQTIGDASD